MTPSPQQQAIFDEIVTGTSNLAIEAVAGSGKTTTITQGVTLTPPSVSVRFLVFAKANVQDISDRLPPRLKDSVSTFHSCWNRFLRRSLAQSPRVDADKCKWLLKDNVSEKDFFTYSAFVLRLVGYAKNTGMFALDDAPTFDDLIAHHDMFLGYNDADESRAVELAEQVLRASNNDTSRIDFDDMLYLPLLKGVVGDRFNFVFLDEAQDTNSVQRELLRRMLSPHGGRLVAVGDHAQAIYGFRGADADALERIVEDFNCKQMPLSVSYRCSRAVVEKARQYVSHIDPSPNAPEGSVKDVTVYSLDDFDPKQTILCRNTAPLVSMAFAFIKRKRGVRILGREIGQGLIALVKKMNSPSSIDSTLEKLEKYREREERKLLRKGQESAAEALNDRIACINLFAENLDEDNRTVSALTQSIDELFNDQSNGGLLTLSSVHKAKGLEWPTVNILDFTKFMPSKYAKQEWQQRQERNLIYVAITRAKENLRFINSGCWKVDTQPKSEEDVLATL